MPLKPKARESDRGLEYLEEKLSLYVGGRGQGKRNPALDILTGRTPDTRTQSAESPLAPAPEPVPAVAPQPIRSHPTTLVLPRPAATRTTPTSPTARASASPWLAHTAPMPKQERVRLVTPPPSPRSLRSYLLQAIAVVLTGGVALGLGIAIRSVVVSSSAPAPIVVEATPAPEPTAVPTVVSQPTVVLQPTIAPQPAAAPKISPTTPPPTAVPSPAAPVMADQFRLLFDEQFNSPALKWPTDATGPAWLDNGMLRVEPREASHFVALGVPGASDLADVVLSGTFKKLDGPGGGGYGFIVRDEEPEQRDGLIQEGRFYVFEVGDRGELGVWLREGNRWVDLLPWTQSDVVKTGQATNELTVSAIGDRLNFMVNGIPVASQHDTVLHRGGIGIFVGGDGNSVGVERLAVRVPR